MGGAAPVVKAASNTYKVRRGEGARRVTQRALAPRPRSEDAPRDK